MGGASEADAAARLARQAFDPAFREAWTAVQIASQLREGHAWLDLGYEDWRLQAFALSRFVDRTTVELLLCAVHHGARRRGFGREMLIAQTGSARERGAQQIFLEVRETNAGAIALYEGFGFREIGRRPRYYRSTGGIFEDAITQSLMLE